MRPEVDRDQSGDISNRVTVTRNEWTAADLSVELTLMADGQEPRRYKAQSAGPGAYRVSAPPVAPGTGLRRLKITVEDGSAPSAPVRRLTSAVTVARRGV